MEGYHPLYYLYRAPDKEAHFKSLSSVDRQEVIRTTPDVFELLGSEEKMTSLKHFGYVILQIPQEERTQEMYNLCITSDPTNLAFVPKEYQTAEMVQSCMNRYAPSTRFSHMIMNGGKLQKI
jgi:hypothetical protein